VKKRILPLVLALCLGLSSCSAMLERSYEVSTPHVDKPVTGEDDAYIRVETYEELVDALLRLVSQREQEGVIRLYDYTGDVENDLSAACLQVATEDPVGAYAVEYIKHEDTRVISYYQAAISIRYRRSQTQMDSMVDVTGADGLKDQLREALDQFEDEAVLRAKYFYGDEQAVSDMIRDLYYEDPSSALGFPKAEIFLYPAEGSPRVVEVLFTWPAPSWELRQRQRTLQSRLEELTELIPQPSPDPQATPGPEDVRESTALDVLATLNASCAYAAEGGSTPYDALVSGTANDQGMALGYVLLCQAASLPCTLVEGTLNDRGRFWTQIELTDGTLRYLDPAAGSGLSTAAELFLQGYRWSGQPTEEELAALPAAQMEAPVDGE